MVPRGTLITVLALLLTVTSAVPLLAQVGQRPAAPAVQPVRPPEPPAPPTRRRGSMVGYIESALIDTRVRVRFDVGSGTDAPDRAEFFYAKCGCFRDLAGTPLHELFDPNAPGPGPGLVTDLKFQQMYGLVEMVVSPRVSFFGELPIRWIQPQSFLSGTGSFTNQSGLGDLNAGIKASVVDLPESVVTTQIKFFLPTGDSKQGLGTDHASIEPALLYYQQVNRIAVESQFGVWIPMGGSDGVPVTSEQGYAGNVLFYGIGPSAEVYRKNTFSVAPVIELVGWHVMSGFRAPNVDVSGTNIVNLKIGGRFEWEGGTLYVGFGKALTTEHWYDKILRFEYRTSF